MLFVKISFKNYVFLIRFCNAIDCDIFVKVYLLKSPIIVLLQQYELHHVYSLKSVLLNCAPSCVILVVLANDMILSYNNIILC